MKKPLEKIRAYYQLLRLVLKSAMVMPVLGCGGGPPPAPKAIAPPPEQSDPGVTSARDAEAMRRRQAASNTVLTGSQGVTAPANVATKALLGS